MISLLGIPIKIAVFVCGFAIAFFGWILYWVGLNMTGATFGGSIGVFTAALAALVLNRQDLFLPLVLILGFIGILLGIFLIRKIHKIFFFLTGVILGIIVEMIIQQSLRNFGFFPMKELWVAMALKIGCGAISGLLLLRYNRYIISVLTAFCGTILILSSWGFHKGMLPGIPIFLLALLFQISLLRKKGKDPSTLR